MRKQIDVTVADNIRMWEQTSQFWAAFCGEDCLHAGFHDTTDLVAEETGIDEFKYVLDVCSGLGGSSMYLASKYGCKLVGLDITASSIEYAKNKAKANGVDSLVEFHVGNALDMPFRANQFDAAYSEDALCHVTDKRKVIDEAVRVLRPGGLFCFTDFTWAGDGEISDEFLNEVCAPMSWPYLETADSFREHFKESGLEVVSAKDRTDFLKATQKEQAGSPPDNMEQIIETYGQEALDGSIEFNKNFLKHIETGNTGYWLFTVRKPS